MREGWEVLPLGDVLTHDVRKVQVEAGREYPIVGVLGFGRGLLFREPVSAVTTSYRELNAIGPDQVVYSKLKAFEGAITVTPPDLTESYASSEFPTFTANERVIPAFLRLLTQRSELWTAMATNSKGMGGRRERLNPSDFLTVRATFPPVPEQRRVVDLISALDDATESTSSVSSAADILLAHMRNDYPSGTERRTISSVVLSIEGGRRIRTSGRAPGEGEPGVLKLSAVQLGSFDASEAKVLDDTSGFASIQLVSDGDLLITRASGSLDRVGYAAIARSVPPDTYLPDLIWRIRTDGSRCLPDFLCHLLASPEYRGYVMSTAHGTASMRKINKQGFGRLLIPLPAIEEQVEYVTRCDLMASVKATANGTRERLLHLRGRLLTTLLSGEHEIPESYDELMEVAS